ncbi:hypothetical protein PISMIDRAFT_329578 [Pisolithus microcarpus 441]|uniref:Unplaced genomic scaffold scaffold_213, whole genome shotgun sequence n=1 Tax=Pisolithus microcarpus 441 TaxID=765257 RepID=A0A0C9XSK6_9AGAM|nr:hypothetical protein BKA83DRAFT_4178090 [Pisolithus microcarpus]KIK15305.1 hypothetical protein PISMIDRAFT_329578 [Pisolithus microcarpus 441]
MYKRKHRKSAHTHDRATDKLHTYSTSADDTTSPDFDPSLYIVAHEADIVSGPRAVAAALALECPEVLPDGVDETNAGSGLIRLEPQNHTLVFDDHDDDDGEGSSVKALQKPSPPHLLVDRYDVRLLPDVLPTAHDHSDSSPNAPPARRPLSPSGWSDLPSDTEDTFFFSPEEAEDYRRDKRRKLIDYAREERMRAILARDRERGGTVVEDSDVWGGSDEKPDETQKELIRRTAVHMISSPNPAQLEMRILANHGADKRFAFLRGRWSRAWKGAKELARQERRTRESEKEEELPSGSSSLQGLIVGYGGSEESGDEPSVGEAAEDEAVDVSKSRLRGSDGTSSDETDRQKGRRERAREWSARRCAEQFSHEGQG